jgi:hypothetical protein
MPQQVKEKLQTSPSEHVKRLLSAVELRLVFLRRVHGECFAPPHIVVPRDTQTFVSTEADFLRAGETLVVFSKLTLVGKTRKALEKVFEFKQELGLVFECHCESFDDRTLKLFAEANGTYIAWPYHRELLHSNMSRMCIPVVLLPLLSPYRSQAAPGPARSAEKPKGARKQLKRARARTT